MLFLFLVLEMCVSWSKAQDAHFFLISLKDALAQLFGLAWCCFCFLLHQRVFRQLFLCNIGPLR
jgi:hypothetical protein